MSEDVMKYKSIIETVPVLLKIKIHFWSTVYTYWYLCKRFCTYLVFKFFQKYSSDEETSAVRNMGRIKSREIDVESVTEDVSLKLGVKHRFIVLKNNTKYHYVEAGDPGKPLALLLHGFPDFWLGFRHQIPLLSQHYHVISLDLKGFGASDKPVTENEYKIDQIISELLEIIYTLNHCDHCILIAHDLGALIAWYLVYSAPKLVRKFFVISSAHPSVFWDESNRLKYNQTIHRNNFNLVTKNHKNICDSITFSIYLNAFKSSHQMCVLLLYYRSLSLSRIRSDIIAKSSDISHVIFITSDSDSDISLKSVVKSVNYVSKYDIHVIEGSKSSFVHAECPKAFNDLLLRHIDKCQLPNVNVKGYGVSPKRLMDGLARCRDFVVRNAKVSLGDKFL